MSSGNKWKSLITLCTRQPSLIFVKFKEEKEKEALGFELWLELSAWGIFCKCWTSCMSWFLKVDI